MTLPGGIDSTTASTRGREVVRLGSACYSSIAPMLSPYCVCPIEYESDSEEERFRPGLSRLPDDREAVESAPARLVGDARARRTCRRRGPVPPPRR